MTRTARGGGGPSAEISGSPGRGRVPRAERAAGRRRATAAGAGPGPGFIRGCDGTRRTGADAPGEGSVSAGGGGAHVLHRHRGPPPHPLARVARSRRRRLHDRAGEDFLLLLRTSLSPAAAAAWVTAAAPCSTVGSLATPRRASPPSRGPGAGLEDAAASVRRRRTRRPPRLPGFGSPLEPLPSVAAHSRASQPTPKLATAMSVPSRAGGRLQPRRLRPPGFRGFRASAAARPLARLRVRTAAPSPQLAAPATALVRSSSASRLSFVGARPGRSLFPRRSLVA